MEKDIEQRVIEQSIAEGLIELIEVIRNIQIPSEHANHPLPYLRGYIDGRLDAALKTYTPEVPPHFRPQTQGIGEERDSTIKYLADRRAVRLGDREIELTRSENALMQYLWNN